MGHHHTLGEGGDDNAGIKAVIKIVSMVIMFLMIMITGSLPLKSERFRNSPMLMSLSSAFSGGLFLAVGILHLLPEANESFVKYFKPEHDHHEVTHGGDEHEEPFPWAFFITCVCFAFVLFIEKIAFASFTDDHDHEHGDHDHAHIPFPVKKKHNHSHGDLESDVILPTAQENDAQAALIEKEDKEDATDNEIEETQRKASTSFRLAKQTKKSLIASENGEQKLNILTPFILQIAIGIHATFEGMAIGIQQNVAECLGIALAVICHKWAEGLTLGIAFQKADVSLKMSLIMIAIQAIMNPIGIAIGWILSEQGDLVTGIFQSISAGTFVYIATAEVITHEFNLKRYRYVKFALFCAAIGFVTSLFFIEQITGG